MKKNILVFPCGSEIAIEVYRSVRYSSHFNLIGANSISDHGRFVFDQYVGDLPFVYSSDFISSLNKVVEEYNIDAIYPTMDQVIATLKDREQELKCKVISSPLNTVKICLSKSRTYDTLKDVIKVPNCFLPETINIFPVFAKPDVGYGSRNVKLIENQESLEEYRKKIENALYCEYLPGEEYTVDCFTDRNGKLRFSSPRLRKRVMNGISVNTLPFEDNDKEFSSIAKSINAKLDFRGAWFIQLKRDANNKLTLLEIAARLAGSSSLYRNKGVNFALLTLYDFFDINIDVIENDYEIELDRALSNKYKINIDYNEVFVDFDDCLVINKTLVNTELISFLYQCLNENIKITLITRHINDINDALTKLRINIFDRIIHIKDNSRKSLFIDNPRSIFIDDSYAERRDVYKEMNIPVFSPDMVESLLK